MIEGSLEVEPPTIWRDEKQSREAESEESRVNRKKIQSREMVGKTLCCVFQMVRGSGGSKSRLPKAAGAESCLQRRNDKIESRCSEKHVCKSKCTKHTRFGPFLEVQMSRICMRLWREAHLQVKMLKNRRFRSTF